MGSKIALAGINHPSSIEVGETATPFLSRRMARHSSAFAGQRRSARLQKLYLSGADDSQSSEQYNWNALPRAKRQKAKNQFILSENTPRPSSNTSPLVPSFANVQCLPRTREIQLLDAQIDLETKLAVIGVDEAGRGPLAG